MIDSSQCLTSMTETRLAEPSSRPKNNHEDQIMGQDPVLSDLARELAAQAETLAFEEWMDFEEYEDGKLTARGRCKFVPEPQEENLRAALCRRKWMAEQGKIPLYSKKTECF